MIKVSKQISFIKNEMIVCHIKDYTIPTKYPCLPFFKNTGIVSSGA